MRMPGTSITAITGTTATTPTTRTCTPITATTATTAMNRGSSGEWPGRRGRSEASPRDPGPTGRHRPNGASERRGRTRAAIRAAGAERTSPTGGAGFAGAATIEPSQPSLALGRQCGGEYLNGHGMVRQLAG